MAAQVSFVEAGLEGTSDTTDSDSVFEASGTEVCVCVCVCVCVLEIHSSNISFL